MFVESSVVDKKHLNFIIGTEKKLNNLLKKLKASETNSEIEYKKLKRAGFSLVFYMACAKLIQRSFSNVRHSKPTLSAIKTPSYNLEKFLVSLIEPIQKIILRVLNSLRKHVNKIRNTLWPILILSVFSPIYD